MDEFESLFPEKKQEGPSTSLQASPTTQSVAEVPVNGDAQFDNLFPAKEKPQQSAFMDMVDSFNNATRKFANGELQLFAKGLSALGVDTSNFQAKLAQDTQNFQAMADQAAKHSPIASAIGAGVGQIGNVVNASAQLGGFGTASTAATLPGRVAQSAGLAAAEAGAEYGDMEDRAMKASTGALLGAAGQGAAESIGYIAKNAVGPLAAKAFKRPVQEAADEISQGGLSTVGQATGRPAIQNTEEALAQVPILGSKGKIQKAAASMEEQAKGVLTKSGVNKMSREELANSLKAEFKKSYDTAAQKTNEAYNAAYKIADENNIPIDLTNTKKAASEALEDMNSLAKEGFSGADITSTAPGKLLNDLANNQNISAKNFEKLRGLVGGTIKDLQKSASSSAAIPTFQKIKGALDTDLESTAAATSNTEFADAITTARNTFKDLKAPFKNDAFLKKAVQEGLDPDQLLTAALKNDRPTLAKTVMKNLTPEGQEVFTSALLQKAAETSTDAAGKLDVSKLGKALHKMGGTLDALPEDVSTAVKGLQKTLANGDYILKAAKPSNALLGTMKAGVMGAAGAGALAFASMGALLSAAGGTKILSSLLTSPTVAKQLVRLGGGKLTEKTANATIKQIIERALIPAAASKMAEQLNTQQTKGP